MAIRGRDQGIVPKEGAEVSWQLLLHLTRTRASVEAESNERSWRLTHVFWNELRQWERAILEPRENTERPRLCLSVSVIHHHGFVIYFPYEEHAEQRWAELGKSCQGRDTSQGADRV